MYAIRSYYEYRKAHADGFSVIEGEFHDEFVAVLDEIDVIAQIILGDLELLVGFLFHENVIVAIEVGKP